MRRWHDAVGCARRARRVRGVRAAADDRPPIRCGRCRTAISFTITSGPIAAARAPGHPLHRSRSSTGRRGSRSRPARGASSRATTRGRASTWDGFTNGPEVGTYHAKLNFVIAGHVGGRRSGSAAIRSQPLEKIDGCRTCSTNGPRPLPECAISIAVTSSPADVLVAADAFFPEIGLAPEHDAAAHAHVLRPARRAEAVGARPRAATTRSSRSRPIRWARAASIGT